MRYIKHRCNSLQNIKATVESWIEFDVCLSTTKQLVICHDQEHRNDPENNVLTDVVDNISLHPKTFFVDVKACGITEAEHLAREVMKDIQCSKNGTIHTWYVSSFNEYCVSEMISIRNEMEIPAKIGVISAGLPLGVFKHLDIDFVVMEYSFLTQDVVDNIRELKLEIYAYTVNSEYGVRNMENLGIDGCIKDF